MVIKFFFHFEEETILYGMVVGEEILISVRYNIVVESKGKINDLSQSHRPGGGGGIPDAPALDTHCLSVCVPVKVCTASLKGIVTR